MPERVFPLNADFVHNGRNDAHRKAASGKSAMDSSANDLAI